MKISPEKSLARMRAGKAEWAHDALKNYCNYDDQDIATSLVDFMSDAMHLVEANGLDFSDIVRRAENHYHAEGGAGHEPDDIAEDTAISESRWAQA